MSHPGPVGPPTPYPVQPGHHGPGVDAVPPPPPGPGVAPPFAAPPTEGRSARVWVGVGVAGLALALCCGGGGVALTGLVVAGSQAVDEQARAVVGDYLDALRDRRYDKAYDLLCDSDQRRESPDEFEQRLAAGPQITSYTVGEATLNDDVTVPVDLSYAGGGRDSRRVVLAQDSGTGRFEVCGLR